MIVPRSHKRLNDLLLSNDLDVLLSVISVLQRQAATYGSQIPIDHAVFRQLRTRLATFARGSESLRSHGFSLKTLASSTLPTTPDDIGQFSVSFYQTQTEGDSAPKSGPTSLAFDAASSTVHDDIAEAAENNHMSVEDQLEAHVKARWIESLRDGESRQKLLAIRLTALAALCKSLSAANLAHPQGSSPKTTLRHTCPITSRTSSAKLSICSTPASQRSSRLLRSPP